ncbi:MAG: polysaccharide biosynthesis tyrosine autokinase [Lachnospiraceae bacterium]|nr:polysaccharide biosynthesis tyrosine autokinase [Lachnospiraceae bacterium]
MVVIKEDKVLDFRFKEAYKTLRANLEFAGDDVKVIAVTSCTPNEGKSSVSMNLAKSIAESGKRVILVDADLRKSVRMGRIKTGNTRYGLSHFLSGQKSFQDVYCYTNIPNLFMVFAGPVPPNPSELLGGKYFRVMIDMLRDFFDYVIIDTPPLGSVIDSAIVAKQCDGSLIVIASNEISYKFAQKIKDQLEKAECRVIGCVLNKVNINRKSYYGMYYGKYYGKDYGN